MIDDQIMTPPLQYADRLKGIPENFVRQILHSLNNKDVIAFTGGLPDADLFPVADIRRAFQRAAVTHARNFLQYSSTEGHEGLRQWIADRYYSVYGMDINPENVLLLNGSQQAIDLMSKIFINNNDHVLIESPSYLGALQSMSVFEPKFKALNMDAEGMLTEDLRQQLLMLSPKLLYTVPTFQNPSGICYSAERRSQIADILLKSNTILLEDNPYGEIYFDEKPPAPISALIPYSSVLMGSFSKIISPGLRLGWTIASPEITDKLKMVKQAADLHSNNISQYMIYHLLSDFDLDDHLNAIRHTYKEKRDVMLDTMRSSFPDTVRYQTPTGGMFFWCELPDDMNASELLTNTLKQGVAFVPGGGFFTNGQGRHTFRMNFSGLSFADIEKGIKIIGREIIKLQNGIL